MAGSLNKVMIIGNLGRDPEVRVTQGGGKVATLNVATSESWIKDGERQEKTEWHRIVVWGKGADVVEKYIKKGSKVLIEGRIQTRKWEKDGQEHFSTEIVADKLTMLDSKKEDDSRGTHTTKVTSDAPFDDEIPF